MLWYPVGWTAGYLVLLVLVAAPLRRSGAYTLPDFAEARLELAVGARRSPRCWSSPIGWLYLMPQFQGAGLSLGTAAGDAAVGGRRCVVGVVVLVNVLSGGHAQHHVRAGLPVLAQAHRAARPGRVPAASVWDGDGRPTSPAAGGRTAWASPLDAAGAHPLYSTYSMIVATFLGTMGLPHVVVRFYTNPDGRAARRTTLVVLGAARRSSTCCLPCTAPSAGSTRPTWSRRARPTPSCSSCPPGWSAGSAATCSPR